MKKYLRLYTFTLLSLWLTSLVLAGFKYQDGIGSLAWITFIFLIAEIFLKPLANLLLLPINLITLGAFRWLINVLILYLVTRITPLLEISSFKFSGYNYEGFIIPSMDISYLGSLIICSFVISFINGYLLWLIRSK